MQAASRKGQKASGVTGLVDVQVSTSHATSGLMVSRVSLSLWVICWCVSVFLCWSVICCCVVLVFNGVLCVGVLIFCVLLDLYVRVPACCVLMCCVLCVLVCLCIVFMYWFLVVLVYCVVGVGVSVYYCVGMSYFLCRLSITEATGHWPTGPLADGVSPARTL